MSIAIALLLVAFWTVVGALVWRRRKVSPPAPSFADISKALDADIAAAEARGVKVDRNDRIAPRRRISF